MRWVGGNVCSGPMSEQLRPYQKLAVEMAWEALKAGERPVVVIPTGGGKTHVGCEIVRRVIENGRRVLWLAHRKELIDQAAARIRRFGIEPGVIMADCVEDRERRVQVASVQTLVRRNAWPADLVIVDEAHHITSKTYERILDAMPGVPLVGLTATPRRLDGKGLKRFFDRIVAPVSVSDLLAMAPPMLCMPDMWAPTQPDLSAAKLARGDFQAEDINRVMRQRHIVGDIVRHYRKVADGCTGIVFACGVEHSREIVAEFVADGITAEHLDGDTPKEERERILCELRDGTVQIVSNVMVLTEGWDLPDLEVVIIARPTASETLHQQMVGRVMRPKAPDRRCILIDHTGNLGRHGSPDTPQDHDLEDRPAAKVGLGSSSKVRVCPRCWAALPTATRRCRCGHVWTGIEVEVHGGELQQIPTKKRAAEALKQRKAEKFCQLLEEAMKCGYETGWAAHRFRAIFGRWPRGAWHMLAVRAFRDICPHLKRIGGVCKFCLQDERTGAPA